LSSVPVDELSTTFAALADPTRREILGRLAEGEATVNQLAEPFPITVQAVSRHLKVLEHAGLITRGRTAQLRPSRLEGEPLRDAVDWLQRYRPFWEDSLARLDQRLHDKTGANTDG
jgi:DNA-binding transcriptional ArsR family regulator